jgi:hypothetical protein
VANKTKANNNGANSLNRNRQIIKAVRKNLPSSPCARLRKSRKLPKLVLNLRSRNKTGRSKTSPIKHNKIGHRNRKANHHNNKGRNNLITSLIEGRNRHKIGRSSKDRHSNSGQTPMPINLQEMISQRHQLRIKKCQAIFVVDFFEL